MAGLGPRSHGERSWVCPRRDTVLAAGAAGDGFLPRPRRTGAGDARSPARRQQGIAGPLPTIADVAVFPWVATADEGGFDIARYPNVRDWAERMLKLPGAAHPYAIMPKEDRVAA
ncbi:MAG TPA: glutathione S-transferase C-terminal domain-containing protein [Alphaproteobacteria bacterium]|nr:glutathione S-transferase C-terminal domain-containing protein [Alphaproteobacteria bacterium]